MTSLNNHPESKFPPINSRKEKSLGLLCSNFLKLYNRDGVESICLNHAATQLGVEKRRIYDIVNILESIGILTKKAKNQFNWKGFSEVPRVFEELLEQARNENFKGLQFRSFGAVLVNENDSSGQSNSYSSYSDNKCTKSSGCSRIENYRKERSLGLLTRNFIKLFMSSSADVISLDTASNLLLGHLNDPTAMKTKVRRLYDIANVFTSMNLLEKTRHPVSGKPSFRWLGPKINTQTLGVTANNSKIRAFGTDITNHVDSLSSLSDWSSKDVTVAMHGNIDCVKVEDNENSSMLVQPSRNSKEFVFGPFRPGNAQNVGISRNKKLKQAQDWENLADTLRPQYCNKALGDLFGHYKEAWKSWYVEADEKKQVQVPRSPES